MYCVGQIDYLFGNSREMCINVIGFWSNNLSYTSKKWNRKLAIADIILLYSFTDTPPNFNGKRNMICRNTICQSDVILSYFLLFITTIKI